MSFLFLGFVRARVRAWTARARASFMLPSGRVRACLELLAHFLSLPLVFHSLVISLLFFLFPVRQMPLQRQTEMPLSRLCQQATCPSRGVAPGVPPPGASVLDLSTRPAGPTPRHRRHPSRVLLLVAARLPMPKNLQLPRVALRRGRTAVAVGTLFAVGTLSIPTGSKCVGRLSFCLRPPRRAGGGGPSGRSPLPRPPAVTMLMSETAAELWPGPLPPFRPLLFQLLSSMRPPPPMAGLSVVRPLGPPSLVATHLRRALLAAWRRATTLLYPVATALRATTRPGPTP